jgi:predicted dehydrogenase
MNPTAVEQVGIAVVGTGGIGMRHLTVFGQMAGVRAVAVPVRPERLQELAQAGVATARDLDEAVRSGARLGLIATDPARHVEDGCAAMDRGMDVLVEKPLAVDAHQAHQLVRHARKRQRTLRVGCVLRFSESLAMFREHLPEVGPLHSVHIECRSFLPDWRPGRAYQQSYSARAHEGGVLRDLIHEVDYAGWIFGWPQALHARVKNLGRLVISAKEVAELTWETATGCVVSIALDYLSRPACRRLQACGAEGTIEWDGLAGRLTLQAEGTAIKQWHSSQTRDELLLLQAEAFVSTACGGMEDRRLATGEDGVRALAVCDAARRSEASRQEEPVEYP